MLRDWIVGSDPGLARLTLALRGTLSFFLAAATAMLVGHLTGISAIEFASGVTLGMMGPFLTREPTLRQRQRTLALLLLPAAGATIVTSLLHGYGLAGDSFFLLLVFLCFLLQPRNPRVIGAGLVAVVTTYVGLYLELPPATLPAQLLSVLAAGPIIAFACFVAVPLNPAATLRRAVKAVQWRAARVLHTTLPGPSGPASVTLLRRDLARLNEAALVADDLLTLLNPEGRGTVRARLIDLELATARAVEALGRETPGPRHATRLLLHGHRMRRGHRYAMPTALLEPGTLRASLVELGHAVHALGIAARTIEPAIQPPPQAPASPGPLAWRLATRVTLAAALAMAGGMALSPQRWFWAVMTVYVVFLNARSRGDTIHKGVQRLGGTLLGIASGLVLATLLAGNEDLQAASLLLAVFGMFYFILVSYTIGIFCVTVMLGLLYGMLGASLEMLLVLRLEETAIGAVAAILVAAFVLPTRTRDQVMQSGRNVLKALVEAVRSSRLMLSGVPGPSPMEAMRQVDRQVADLRLALAPLTAGRSLLRRSALERPVPALIECVHWTRALAAASHRRSPANPDPDSARQAASIEIRLAMLAGIRPDHPDPAQPQAANASSAEIRITLERLNTAVETLTGRLEIGALEEFALDH
jgi:uncharacterized membrane protein YccC